MAARIVSGRGGRPELQRGRQRHSDGWRLGQSAADTRAEDTRAEAQRLRFRAAVGRAAARDRGPRPRRDPAARSGGGAVHRPRPLRRHRQRDAGRAVVPGRARRARTVRRGRHALRLQCRRAGAGGLPADLARRRRRRGHRAGGALRLRRLGDRPHRHGDRPDGAAAGRAQRGAARGGGPRPSRRRLRERGVEALLRGGAGREPAHRAQAPRGALACGDLAHADRRDLHESGQRERGAGGRRSLRRDRRRPRRRHADDRLRRRGPGHARRHVRQHPVHRAGGGRELPGSRRRATAGR